MAGLFEGWLEEHFPDRKARVLHRVQDVRGGRLNESRFGHRMHGVGPIAEHIRGLFNQSRRRYHLDQRSFELSTAAFRRPGGEQLALFQE